MCVLQVLLFGTAWTVDGMGCGGAMVVVHWPQSPSAISHWCQTVPSGSVAAPTSAVKTLCNQVSV